MVVCVMLDQTVDLLISAAFLLSWQGLLPRGFVHGTSLRLLYRDETDTPPSVIFNFFAINQTWLTGCCYICPRASCPRRPWSKVSRVQGTVVQGDFGPRKLLSKEAFTSDKLAQIILFYSLLDLTILIDYKMTKNIIWTALNVANFFLGQ